MKDGYKNEEGLKEILRILEEEDDFLITSHIRPDGDALSSENALGLFLKRMKKRYEIVNQDPAPEIYTFLPDSDQVKSPKEVKGPFRIACILDCFNPKRIGENITPMVESCQKTINIDHHPGKSEFRGINLILPSASSTSEILYDLMKISSIGLDREIALCLYVGILTDTGFFGHSSVTARTHLVAADLLRFDLDVARISHLVSQINLPQMKLLSLVFDALKIEEDKIAYGLVTQEMLNKAGMSKVPFETEFILKHIRRLKGIEVCLFFHELSQAEIKVSLRSNCGLDVNMVAQTFGGGGHKGAAGCIIYSPLESAIHTCLLEVKKGLSIII